MTGFDFAIVVIIMLAIAATVLAVLAWQEHAAATPTCRNATSN